MKRSLGLFILLFSTVAFGQTSVISVRSHSGDLEEIPEAQDKFGEFVPTPIYDTLIKTEDDCVIQIGTTHYGHFRDTVCEHWYYDEHGLTEDAMRNYYGQSVVLIGFESKGPIINGNDSPFSGRNKQNSSKLIFILLTLTGLGTYIFSSKKE